MGNTSSASKADGDDDFHRQIIAALEANQVEQFKELVKLNLSSSKQSPRNKDSHTYSYLATIYDNVEILNWLIETVNCNPNETDDHGRTLLHFAAKEGCLQTLAYLITEAKSDIEAIDSEGYNSFLYAVYEGQLPCAKYLAARMNQNSIPTQALYDGRTSVHLCAQQGHVVVLKWLIDTYPSFQAERIEKTEGMTAFHLAARFGHATVLDFLLRHCQVDPNTIDTNGRTALHHAAENNHIDAVRYLIEQVCLDPHLADHSGRSSIDYASSNPSSELSRFLAETSPDFI